MEVDEGDNNVKIDESLYSRQLYVMGHEAQRLVGNANILIIGVNGLGIEIAKNVALAGVKRIVVYDNDLATPKDLGSQFYINENELGKPRGKVSTPKLAELNEYVKLETFTGNFMEIEFLKQFQVVVCASCINLKKKIELNDLCRKSGSKFIACQTNGLFASAFCDFGEEFTVVDTNGEPPISRMISSITQDEKAVITVHEEARHGLETGAFVRFSEVEGMTEINSCKPIKITVKGPYSFEIPINTTSFASYKNGGYIHEVKQPNNLNFKPLGEALKQPGDFLLTDFAKFGRCELLHIAFQALALFEEKHGQLPEPGNMEQCNEFINLIAEINASTDNDMKILDDDWLDDNTKRIMLAFASGSIAELAPMTAFLGGVVGQEVLKACSGKFSPIHQFLYFDACECLPDGQYPLSKEECSPINTRYDSQIAVFGKNFVLKLNSLNMFLVGAGAIGCEMLKNWALMGVGTKPNDMLISKDDMSDECKFDPTNGKIHVTDMDKIERSNLNRQFLFRDKDVGSSKSEAAKRAVISINESINVKSYEEKVSPDTEAVFSDDFMASLDMVCTALDNVEARLYVDQRCLHYAKPMLESGTLGTKGNTQVVVPHLTENYGASRDPPEKSIPVCTLKHFPYEIAHCVQWARDWFEGVFVQNPRNVNQYLTNPQFMERLDAQQNVKVETLKSLKSSLVSERPRSFEECITWARLQFNDFFTNSIKQLLHNFPPGMVTSTGAPFWSGTKREPVPLEFDINDQTHLDFIIAAANLRAYNYNLQGDRDPARFKSYIPKIQVPEFIPKQNIKIAANDQELKEQNEQNDDLMDIDQLVDKIVTELPKPKDLVGFKLTESEFEKDDDTNFHIDVITATSNLRARNYRIAEANKHETKRVAGRIIPAIATTTALVTGLVCLELYKLTQGKQKVEDYKNGFVNLALPFFAFSEPIEVKKVVAGDLKWSIWDKIDIDGTEKEYTLADFLQYFTDKFKVEVNMLSYAVSILHSFFSPPSKKEERRRMTMKELVENVTKTAIPENTKYLTFEVLCVDEDDNDVELPPVRYRIR